jgi:hypothetical protein
LIGIGITNTVCSELAVHLAEDIPLVERFLVFLSVALVIAVVFGEAV